MTKAHDKAGRALRRPDFWQRPALVVLVGGVLAQPGWAMDFEQAYAAALQNDAMIRASRAGTQAQRERVPQAKSQLLPQVSLSAGRNYNDLTSETPVLGQAVRSNYHYYSGNQVLSVRQPLYRPYQMASLRQAQAQVEDAEALLQKDEQALVVRVGEAYFDVLLAEDQLALVLAQKTAYTVQLEAAQKTFAAGRGTRTDVDEAQARLDMTLALELETRQNRETTRHRLQTLVGGDVVNDLSTLDTAAFSPQAPVPDSVDAWISRAEATSPELQSLRAQVEVAREEVEKARAGHRPTLDVVAQWSRSNSDSVTNVRSRYDNKTLGLQLNVPLYGGGYVSSTVRQAVAAQTRAEEMLEATRRDLAVRVRQQFRGMTEGAARILALEQAVRSAEQAVLSNQKSFAAGIRTTVDVLNAEQQKTQALRDLAQARYRYVLARLQLQALAGDDREAAVSVVNSWLMR